MQPPSTLTTALITSLLLMLLGPLASSAGGQQLQSQRQAFLAAEKALKQGDQQRYRKLEPQLRDYPLYPYLRFQALKAKLSRLNAGQASTFLERYRETPLAGRFRRSWLDELYRRGDWTAYVRFYRPGSGTRRQCRYLQALLNTGDRDAAFAAVPELWLTGRSLPDACDPVLAAWRQAGQLTPEQVWARIALAMQARRPRLARYLGRFLPSDQERRWLHHWLELHRRPEKLAQLEKTLRQEEHPYREQILLHALQRLARTDPGAASSTWRQLAEAFPFTGQQRYQAERALLKAAMDREPADLMLQLAAFEPLPEDTRLLEQRIRTALKQQEWELVQAWIEALPEPLGATERWRYWKGRALEARGEDQAARGIYRKLAESRSYYGFLAADRLGLPYNLSHTPLEVAAEQLAEIAALPGMQRAAELYRLDRLLDARREWHAVTAALTPPELQAASRLAQDWGWHTQAIFTLARTGYWEDLELRFPIEHQQTVDQASRRRKLDDAWVFAVIRQESAFATDARSSAGALGLMQLMPRTARHVARNLKRRPPKTRDLMQAATNIELGTAYLNQVLARLHDNPVLATSAYNAGPHRVKQWLPEQSLPADLWIELIPFPETRRYTQRVLTYAVIYEQRLGREPGRMAARMPDILPRPVATASREKKAAGRTAPPG